MTHTEASAPSAAQRLSTAASLIEAVRLVTHGKVYPLDHIMDMSIPQLAVLPPWVHLMLTHPGATEEQAAERRPGPISDRLALNTHTGTHIDALGHWSFAGRSFDGVVAAKNWTPRGLKRLGIEECGPILCRGVLLDVAATRGVAHLNAGEAITPQDLEASCEKAGLSLRPGDAVLVRTGWAKLWGEKDRYVAGEPGLTADAAEWLADRGVIVIGGDTMAIDIIPPPPGAAPYAVHNLCLVERGVHLLENMDLETIAADGVNEFLFIVLPARIRGATGCPVLPIAVR